MSRAPTFKRKLDKARERAVTLASKSRLPVYVFRSGPQSFAILTEPDAELMDWPPDQALIRVTAR